MTTPEDDVQATIVEGLIALGYHVDITSRQRRACSHCHKFSHRGDGSSKGLANLMVGRESWGWMRMALEVKGSKTPLSPEQTDLRDRGLMAGEALTAQDALRDLRHPRLVQVSVREV